mmetsp:Transcript_6123/g.11295  ORF Transcript_6123/g.11295 Transcript_6123/m.11295 type:complete len:408 (+) Transcript_6123:135-1358(+)|eukprot:CAMPEP_0197525518 /NCGR_PEP_ID=MMETSP1318-20131121/12848_1 /TAXON_ID=552666 /ORGANISM="Partenskyella glossopodia, Strain RCC365" /LENGTH=407 /DNA_ID=CAMNT_0043079031 /DNA_START=131 /DNA_END=1354 /DNA_ORIENTATION=+
MPVHESIFPYCAFYLLGYVIFLSVTIAGVWSWGGIMVGFGVIPLMDLIISEDTTNPTKQQARHLSTQLRFKLVPALWVPVQFWLVMYCASKFAEDGHGIAEYIGMLLSSGALFGGIGINVAHELIHKSVFWERSLGRLLLISVCYGHWADEHLYGHHRLVATPWDPATSNLNQSVYSFWWQSVTGTWRQACAMERYRLRNKSQLRQILENMVVWSCLGSLCFAVVIYLMYGWGGLLYFCLQAPVSLSMLEFVNYIEHYGLRRELRPHAPSKKQLQKLHDQGNLAAVGGAYEKVSPFHSWNAGQTVSNYFLLKLQRHSDHHANGHRRYQTLRSFIASPQLPTGYSGCILLSLIPPLWFRIMNPIVTESRNRSKRIKKTGIQVFNEKFDALARSKNSIDEALREVAETK